MLAYLFNFTLHNPFPVFKQGENKLEFKYLLYFIKFKSIKYKN